MKIEILTMNPDDELKAYLGKGKEAKDIISNIIERLKNLPENHALLFNLNNSNVDYEFANYVISKLMLLFGSIIHNKYLILKNLNEYTLSNIKKVLIERRLAIIYIDEKERWTLLGTAFGECYRVAFRILAMKSKITSFEMAKILNITQRAAQKHLSFLFQKRLIGRSKIAKPNKRWEYIYTFISNRKMKEVDFSI